ncbi:MAG: C40 family peptidase [Lachnospiraceae bacterium]|nr:C40 family peptidase [Lachnospiraceae bacterium]
MKNKRGLRFFFRAALICGLSAAVLFVSMPAEAFAEKSKSELKKEQQKSEAGLAQAEAEAEAAAEGAAEAEAEAAAAEEELVALISTVEIIEGEIEDKRKEIEQAQADYEAAKQKEEELYQAMVNRIRFMYENGDLSQQYLQIFLESKDMADFLNRRKYASELYDYDRKLLAQYDEAKKEVKERELALKEDLEEMEEEKNTLEEQQKLLEQLISEQRKKLANFESILSSARAKASAYKQQINEANAQIRAIEKAEAEERRRKAEEEKRRKEEEARKKKEAEEEGEGEEKDTEDMDDYSERSGIGDTGEEDDPGDSGGSGGSGGKKGSATGNEVASYAKKFIGNPYVPGGTSLTEGCDCSGFTSSVYSHFGYSIPRTSYAQASCGRGVSYSDAEPGDIICYAGHVGIYIGGGQIVHASTPATGIKITPATYREILSVRRIV